MDTPNLDELAAKGLRFTQAYSTARCGPSRSCLLTGYYAQQTASDIMTPGRVPAWTRFVPQYLKPLGYCCYHAGKWHIRVRPVAGARFDHSYCLLDQNRFFTPTGHLLEDEPLPPVKESEHYYATVNITNHAINWLKGHAKEQPGDPFYLYLAYTSPHFPLHALAEDIEHHRDRFAEGWDTVRERRWQRMRRMGLINCGLAPLEPGMLPSWNMPEKQLIEKIRPGEVARAVPWSTLTAGQRKFQRTKMAIHAAMITRMDREIGRVLAQLKAMDAYRDTVILFLSDNGASSEQLIRSDGHDQAAPAGSARSHLCLGPGWASASNAPFRLHKSWVHEGGISSPLIVHWPAGIAETGKLGHDPCHFVDVLPTLVDLADGGATAKNPAGGPPLAGRSLVPALRKDGTVQREFLYFNHARNRTLRAGGLEAGGRRRSRTLGTVRPARGPVRAEGPLPLATPPMASLWKKQDYAYISQRESAPAIRLEQLPRANF